MLLPYFQWMQDWGPSVAIRNSVWFYAFVQCAHLVALTVFAGSILIVDLRLMGRGMRQQPLAQVARDAQPWMVWSFLALAVTGIPQLMSNSIKEYYAFFFWMKMVVLVVAIIYTCTLRRKVTLADEARTGPFKTRLVGFVSTVLWLGVAVPARLIGLF